MTKEQYVQEQQSKLESYVKDVTDNRIIVCSSIKEAVERYVDFLSWDKVEFRNDKIEWFWKFCYYINIEQNGRYTQFDPSPWQVFYLSNIYGFYFRDSNKRYFNTSYLTVSRKAGKTILGVIQSLFHLTLDGSLDARCYTVSESKVMSAESALFYAKKIVENSPDLEELIERRQYSLRYQNDNSTSEFKMLPNKPDALNSLKPSFGLLDELHTHVTSDVFDMMKNGMMASFNHLLSVITTRGNDTTRFQKEYEDSLKQILTNKLESRTFIMMFHLDDEKEMNDPHLWVKSNPNLGVTFDLDELKDIYRNAKLTPVQLKNFFIFNLNMWVDFSENDWLTIDTIKKNKVKSIDLPSYANWDCWVGADFSSVTDLTSISVLFYNDQLKKFIVHPLIYIPNTPEKKVRKGNVDLTNWISQGWIKECETNKIDYQLVFDDIKKISETYNIHKFGYDPANVSLFISQIENELLGDICQEVKQGYWLNESMKFVQSQMLDGNVLFENPAMKWQLQNVQIVENEQGTIKAGKKKSKDSIDSVISTLCAFEVYIREQKENGNFNSDIFKELTGVKAA